MEKKLQKLYLTNYNLLIAEDSWQDNYQILLINLLKKFLRLNANIDIKKKKIKMCGIKNKDCKCYLESANVEDDLILYKCLCCNRNYPKSLTKT